MFGWFSAKRLTASGPIRREFNTTIAGVDLMPNGTSLVRELKTGDRVFLVREPNNPHDSNAIAVANEAGFRFGYIPARIAADVTRALEQDDGALSNAVVVEKLAEGRDTKRFNAVVKFVLTRNRRR